MALTPTEEAKTRDLIAQQSALLSLAGVEPTILSKLGATKVTLSALPSASVLNDSDLLLVRQGTTDKSVAGSVIKALIPPVGAVLGKNKFTDAQDFANTVNVASASTVNLNAMLSNTGILTGTTTITAFTLSDGAFRTLACPAGITLTYNATTCRLNTGGTNYTTQAGDVLNVQAVGTTIYVEVAPASGRAVASTPVNEIFSLTAVNSSNTLVITRPASAVSPASTTYRNASLADGTTTVISNTTNQTLTLPVGASLGFVNATLGRMIVLEVLNADGITDQLAVVNANSGLNLNETGLISTTAISASATSASVIYSTTAVTNRPYRVIGFIDGTWATAGTYAVAPSLVQGIGATTAIQVAMNAQGSAPMYACRAWVNFNGIGTVAIRASGNVLSITDNGVGDYAVNLITAMPDVNYCTQISTRYDTSNGNNSFVGSIANVTGSISTTSVRIYTQASQVVSSRLDSDTVCCSIFR